MIYVFLANGFEEMEAMAPIDCLRRAGKQVVTVAVGGAAIRSSHGMHVIPDLTEQEITLDESLEMIVLPGGMPGTLNLENSEQVQKAIAYCAAHVHDTPFDSALAVQLDHADGLADLRLLQ